MAKKFDEMTEQEYLEAYNSKPIRSFEMFSPEGDKLCTDMVREIIVKILGCERITKEQVIKLMKDAREEIDRIHGEVTDTEPSHHIARHVRMACIKAGYSWAEDIDRFSYL